MISQNDVDLLIFDLDGTILQSVQAISEAIKTALFKVNQNIQISNEDIEKHLGEPSGDFYRNILPSEIYPRWQEIRTEVRKLYISSLKNFGQAFPDVIETLAILSKRGYRLALYSNSSVQYFDAAISTLGIQDYFDFTECSEENGLTKTELVKKIKNTFPGLKSTVIGDRIDDIKAAKENDTLSVGALYGYGGKEPEQADITINKFSELLNIFDRKLPIFEKILDEIKNRMQKNKAFVVGITGIDCSGKTKFAESLEQFLISKDFSTQLISLDDFHNPMVYRYSGEDQAENYFNKSFDIDTVLKKLLVPLTQKSDFSTHLTLLDWKTDKYENKKEFSFHQDTIVLFEGVFLFRKELSPYIDYKIFIEIPFEESKKRAKMRDSKAVLKKYDEKYLPAQRRYLDEYPPSETSDMIIDNSNWEYPKIKSLR